VPEERLQKILSQAGVASRRQAEKIMLEGRVTVNGAVITELGSKADLDTDHIKVDGKLLRPPKNLVYIVLNKPRSTMTTVSDPEGRDTVMDCLRGVKERVTYCSTCGNLTDVDPCMYCTDGDRDARIICVVEQPENVSSIERARGFRGRYHVLMGTISPLQGIGPDELKIKGLLGRVAEGGVEEIILATNPNVEGEATAMYLAKLLKPLGVRVSRIAMGVPVGSDLDYTDEFTMSKAMEGRREL